MGKTVKANGGDKVSAAKSKFWKELRKAKRGRRAGELELGSKDE